MIVQLGESKDIHEALKMHSFPIPQAKDEKSSILALREWLLSQVRDESPSFLVAYSKSGNLKVFGIWGLSYAELVEIMAQRWLGGKVPAWMTETKASIPGKIVTLLPILAGQDSSEIHLSNLANLF